MNGQPFPYSSVGSQAMERKLPLRLIFAHAVEPRVERAAKTMKMGEGRSLTEHLKEPHMW